MAASRQEIGHQPEIKCFGLINAFV